MLETPPSGPVWWAVYDGPKRRYVKAQTWFEARQKLNGHPLRVLHEHIIQSLEQEAKDDGIPITSVDR